MKKEKILTVIFIVIIIMTNFIWYKIYLKEHNKLNHAVIPSLSEDYFTAQKILTGYQIQTEKLLINPLGTIGEIKYGLLPYNIYFQSEKDYQNFIKENTNIKEAPLVLQNPDYPNGCEAASAVMLLQYEGINLTLKEFIESYLLTDKVYEENGERFGPNPAFHYAGDPSSPNRGWGALEPVIISAISKVISAKDADYLKNNSLMSSSTKKLPLYLVAANTHPSLIWITQDYQKSDEVYEWFSYDSKNTYTYPKKSHTVLLTGMDEKYYYINDPLKAEKNIPIPKEQLEATFDSMGRQFISIT